VLGFRGAGEAPVPADIRIIHAHEFIQATPDGQFDLEATKKVLIEIVSMAAPSNNYDILLDTRGARSELTVAELLELATEVHKVRKAFTHKSALLVPRERLDHAEFFAGCAQERGIEVKAFVSLGDAMAWLAGV